MRLMTFVTRNTINKNWYSRGYSWNY